MHAVLTAMPMTLAAIALAPAAPLHAGSTPIFGDPEFYSGSNDYSTVAADFDGDGDIDILTASPPRRDGFGQLVSHGKYVLHESMGTPGAYVSSLIDDEHGGSALVRGDLDGDGLMDVASTNTIDVTGNLINVLLSRPGGFEFASYGTNSDAASAIALGDMDGDGDLDIVVPNGGHVWLNDGTGSFSTNFVGSGVSSGDSIALGDLDEDGHLDIVTTSGFYFPDRHSVKVQFGIGDGDGNPGPPQLVEIGGDSPAIVELADLDGDGHLDLVTVNQASTDVSVLPGLGDGTFAAPTVITPNTSGNFVPEVLNIGDFNNDGVVDLVVTSIVYGQAEYHYETSVLLGDGAGAYSIAQVVIGLGGQRLQYHVAVDLEGDGDLDLANAVHLLFNLTDPALPGDTDGDGVVDLGDLLQVLATWGPCDGCPSDLDGDGVVGFNDLLIVLANWS